MLVKAIVLVSYYLSKEIHSLIPFDQVQYLFLFLSSRIGLFELFSAYHWIGQRFMHISNERIGVSWHLLSATWSRSNFRRYEWTHYNGTVRIGLLNCWFFSRCWWKWWLLLLFTRPPTTLSQRECNVLHTMACLASGRITIYTRRIFNIRQFGTSHSTSLRISQSSHHLLH